MPKVHKKVSFKGETYWLSESDVFAGQYNLSPLDHYSEDGELLANPFRDISFAVVMDGEILRFGNKIGDASELVDVVVKEEQNEITGSIVDVE